MLEPMSLAESESLITSEAIRTGKGWLTTDQEAIGTVTTISGRIPLAIKLIVPRLDNPKALRNYQAAVPKHQKDLLDFCYDQTFRDLSGHERKLFFSLSVFDDGATLADLAFILEADLNDTAAHDTLLQEIEKLWNVSVAVIRQVGSTARYEMQSLVRRFASRRLATDAGLKHDLRLRLSLLEVRKADDLTANAKKAVEAYSRTGNYEDAMALLDACLKRDSRNAEAWVAKAEIEMRHGKHLHRAAAAAAEARKVAEHGGIAWRNATVILAEVEMQPATLDLGRAIELLCEIDEKAADCGVWLLLGECYARIGASIRSETADDAKRAGDNCAEAVDCARRAATRAHSAVEKARAFALWARAALPFNEAMAYQAAERALSLDRSEAAVLREIMHKAESELSAIPTRDLLFLDE